MLTSTSRSALRLLVALARVPSEELVPGRTLARRTSVPANYLSKILHAQGSAGLVEAVRGRGGGYRLGRPPDTVRQIDAVEVFEGVRTHPGCLLGVRPECSDADPCSAHAVFRDVRARWIAFLEETTVADAAEPRPASHDWELQP